MILFAILMIMSVYMWFKTVYNVKIIYTHALIMVYIGLQQFITVYMHIKRNNKLLLFY